MTRNFATWHLVNQECLPWFGNDVDRIIWDVDVMQLIAIVHASLGNAGDSINKRLKAKLEEELVVDKLKEFGHENADA